MAKKLIGVDSDFDGNSLLNMGEESISPSAIITPPSFAVNQNNYNPVGLQLASLLRLSATVNSSITGITAPDTARWKKLIIINFGASNIILSDADANSVASNRFAINGNIILNQNEGIIFIYSQSILRWVAIGRSN